LIRRRTIHQAQELKRFKTIFIGVTGSYGKSSVKEFLAQVLSKKYKVEYTSGNRNTDMVVALDIVEKYHDDLDFYIVEMGAYSKGEISQICDVVKPKYGILTGLGNQHIDLFGSKENLIEAKSELFDSLPNDGFAIINADSEGFEKALKHADCDVVRYGENPLSEVQVLEVKYKGRLSFVKIKYLNHHYQFTTSLLGKHNILNLLGVIALAMKLNMGFEAIQQAIATINPIIGKLSLHKGIKKVTFLNDSYNSNVNGFKSALEVMKDMEYSKKYIITNGIFELGKDRGNVYTEIKDLADKYKVHILTTDRNFKGAEYAKSEAFIMDKIDEGSLVLIEGRFSPIFMKSLKLRKFKV
jgi:UDP-N-acetylmuramoyl-tripeptide--D-alanyl-D-alanine ligase